MTGVSSLKLTVRTWKWTVGRSLSFWQGPFPGAKDAGLLIVPSTRWECGNLNLIQFIYLSLLRIFHFIPPIFAFDLFPGKLIDPPEKCWFGRWFPLLKWSRFRWHVNYIYIFRNYLEALLCFDPVPCCDVAFFSWEIPSRCFVQRYNASKVLVRFTNVTELNSRGEADLVHLDDPFFTIEAGWCKRRGRAAGRDMENSKQPMFHVFFCLLV